MSTKDGYELSRIDMDRSQLDIIKTMKGSRAYHVEKALTLYLHFHYSVYLIRDLEDNSYYVSYYDMTYEAQDLYWHYVNTRGSYSIGRSIRNKGVDKFEFKVVYKSAEEKAAVLAMKVLKKVYSKGGKYKLFDC